SINAIDWNLKTINNDVFTYVQQLISLRKAHPAFRMQTTAQIQNNLRFLQSPTGIIGYHINGIALKDKWKDIQVWFNGNAGEQTLPSAITAGYKTAVLNNEFVAAASGRQLIIKGYSCVILYRD
ncbi:MAG: type I pullulanase, partial [Bacteroidetes bacterium]|nr:type I pullulanase [Bacteroidota bacterium]